MKLPVSVTISVAIHAAAVALVAAWGLGARDARPREVQTTAIEVVPVPPPEPPPVDVQFLDEAATRAIGAASPPSEESTSQAPVPPTPPKKNKPRAPRTAAVESRATGKATTETAGTSGTSGTSGTTGDGTEPTGPRSKYFDMRAGGRVDLSLPKSYDALDHAPAGTSPRGGGVAKSGQLEDSAGGRKKSNQDVFVARVERDGSVTMKDTKNLQIKGSFNPAKILSGRFDVTDYLMRKTKNDPYASRKLKFLDDTRDERVEIGTQWRQQQLMQTAMIMRKNLERAWASSGDIAAKKRALFDLWDEIVEPRTAEDQADEVLTEASRAARKAVIGFIRTHLPAGSEHAYSETELVALNSKKQSSARFAPYD